MRIICSSNSLFAELTDELSSEEVMIDEADEELFTGIEELTCGEATLDTDEDIASEEPSTVTHTPEQSAPPVFGSQLSVGSSTQTSPSSHENAAMPPHIFCADTEDADTEEASEELMAFKTITSGKVNPSISAGYTGLTEVMIIINMKMIFATIIKMLF